MGDSPAAPDDVARIAKWLREWSDLDIKQHGPREPTNLMLEALALHSTYEMPADIQRLRRMWRAAFDAALAQESESKKPIPPQAEGE
jgi:hypothetical protein